MRCLTQTGQRRRPGCMRMPHMKQGPAGHGRAPALYCLPLLSLHTMSRKSPQLIEFFTETESSDGRFMKFLSGEVSQPQAGPAGRGDRAGSGSGKAGAWASQHCWGKNTTQKSQPQFVLMRNSVPSFPQKPHLTGEKPSIQCQGMCMLFWSIFVTNLLDFNYYFVLSVRFILINSADWHQNVYVPQ